MERHLGGNLMKKKFMKSVLSITLVIVAVFTFSSAIMQPRWKYVSTISGDINIHRWELQQYMVQAVQPLRK